MITDKKTFSRIGLAALISFLVNITLVTVIQKVVFTVAPSWFENSWIVMSLTMLPLFLIAYPIGVLIMKSLPNAENENPMPQGKLSAPQIIIYTIASYGVMLAINLLGTITSNKIASLLNSELNPNPLAGLVSTLSPYATIVFTVILAPIIEELFFRKLIYKKTAAYGDKAFIFFSALIFGLFHGNLFQSLYAFIMGIILAYVYVYTGKIIYTMAIHVFVNFLGLGVPSLAAYYGGEVAGGVWGTIAIILAIIGLVLFFTWMRKKLKEITLAQGTKIINKKSNIILNIGVILFIIVVTLNMIFVLLGPLFVQPSV